MAQVVGILAVAVPASAGVAAAASVTAVAMEPGRARPRESGGHDSAATVGPLAIGAAVRDRNGIEIGHVTRLTTDRSGHSVAEVRQDEDVFWIPVDQLHASSGAAVSALTADELRRSGAAH
jgi:ABC-type transporter Mla subunit MlaD